MPSLTSFVTELRPASPGTMVFDVTLRDDFLNDDPEQKPDVQETRAKTYDSAESATACQIEDYDRSGTYRRQTQSFDLLGIGGHEELQYQFDSDEPVCRANGRCGGDSPEFAIVFCDTLRKLRKPQLRPKKEMRKNSEHLSEASSNVHAQQRGSPLHFQTKELDADPTFGFDAGKAILGSHPFVISHRDVDTDSDVDSGSD